MRSCISEKEFNRYLEDSFSPSSYKEFEAHINSCEACRKEFETWKDLKEQLNAASNISMPHSFKENVMARVAIEKIRPAPAGGSVRRVAALAFVSIILLYYILKPVLGPSIDSLLRNLFMTLSTNLYAALVLIGIDPSVPIRIFGDIMSNMNTLFPVFALSTFLMIVSFVILVIKGKTSTRTFTH